VLDCQIIYIFKNNLQLQTT